jgi:lipoprotein-anchoring transpeptidase ErfK/SrfK
VRLWRGGRVVLQTPANTGIPASPTPSGTWPIYLRYRSTTMKGTDPSGDHYVDRGVPWVSYFHGGDALHGFERASYGSRQSLGCVELPARAAKAVWRLVGYGTLVTVLPA